MSQYRTGTARIIPNAIVLAAATAAQGSAGNVDVGAHSWVVTAVHGNGGETIAGLSVPLTVTSSAKQVNLTNVPLGPTGTVSRKIYRTVAGDTGSNKYVGTIADNTTTAFTDNVSDASLSSTTAPSSSTFPSDTVELTGGGVITGNIALGNIFKFQGENAPFFVSSVSTLQFFLTTVYNGAKIAGTFYPYLVARNYTTNISLPELAAGDVDTADIFTRAVRLIDSLIVSHKVASAGIDELIQALLDTDKALVIRGFSLTQSANILEIQKSDGTSLFAVFPTGAFGNTVGSGGTVTQATSKSTGVTLSKPTGQITLNGAALAGDTTVSFTLTNTVIAATDLILINHVSAGTAGSYLVNAQAGAGSAIISVRNITTGSLSEAIVLGFVVIKGATT